MMKRIFVMTQAALFPLMRTSTVVRGMGFVEKALHVDAKDM
jgi:hypothetical protein